MKSNKKVKSDTFDNITPEIRSGGLNIKQWALSKGLPVATVRCALYGYPRTPRAAMIRAEARAAVRRLHEKTSVILSAIEADAKKLFSK